MDVCDLAEPFGVRIGVHTGHLEISTSSGLPTRTVVDANVRPVATVVGHVLAGWSDCAITVSSDRVAVDTDVNSHDDIERKVLPGLHGVYIVLTDERLGRRVYLDAGGAIPIVYSPQRRMLASSADQLLTDAEYRSEFDHDLHRRLITKERMGAWVPGTLTAHHDVRRLLPNHALDLEDFSAHRWWPASFEDVTEWESEQSIPIIARALRGYVSACAHEFETTIALSAGYDSRLLLAASRGVADKVQFATFGQPTQDVDQVIAAEISRHLGLSHVFVDRVTASDRAAERWDRLVGDAVREIGRTSHPSLERVPGSLLLTGLYGEIGRGHLYKHDATSVEDAPLDAETIVRRLALPTEPALLGDVDRWLAPLEHHRNSVVLDLAYDEIRAGSWAMAQSPAQKAMKLSMTPFAQLAIREAFIRTPPAEKAGGRLFHEVGEQLWPAAMEFPVNRYGDRRDRWRTIRRALDPARLRRVLRRQRGT